MPPRTAREVWPRALDEFVRASAIFVKNHSAEVRRFIALNLGPV
jgi:hypothetical protein